MAHSIDLSRKYQQKKGVPFKQIEEDGILLDLESGMYFEVNETGLYIWTELTRGGSGTAISKKVARKFGISERQAKSDTRHFMENLLKLGLLTG